MTYEIYSFAHISLPKPIVDLQFQVFDKFGLEINQIINDNTHGKNLENLSTNHASEMSKKSIFYGPDFSICFRNMNPADNQTYN